MILHRKSGENAIFMQAMKKIEGLFFECVKTRALEQDIFCKMCTNMAEK